MLSGIAVDSIIPIRHRGEPTKAKVRRVGPLHRGDDSVHRWSMLTLDVDGQCVYAVCRDDELRADARDAAEAAA